MKEIRCPHCNKVFTIDDPESAELLNQVRSEMEKMHKTEMALAVAKKQEELTERFNRALSDKENEIGKLNSRISQSDADKQIALMKADREAQAVLQNLKDRARQELDARNSEILRLRNEAAFQKEQHQRELDMKDEVIAQYKDFKAKQSTKGIGESLEVYCSNQFELMVHPYLPDAEFGKDNEIIEGTKGDFVFRDFVDGIESVSIMFEMKNEADETSVKHKNSDFFRKLDMDRTKKHCEYAVLVSLLELDNDLYNNGIYPVPNYEKMYVVRPQQFLTIISILVQTGRNTVGVKKELADARDREIDVTHFEEKLNTFKRVFGGHVQDAAKRYQSALDDIDAAIRQLTNMKEDLRLWVDHLYKADKNFDDISIRKLTYNNPTMRAKLEEARERRSIPSSSEE